jgi:hypothetical protein
MECITPIIDYVESQFKKTSAFENLGEPETINMLSGNGGSQVDAVLYIISNSNPPLLCRCIKCVLTWFRAQTSRSRVPAAALRVD